MNGVNTASEGITVVATNAEDVLIGPQGEIGRQPGGPMMFIKAALLEAKVSFTPIAGESIVVEILVEEELGRVPNRPTPRSLGDLVLSNWVILSTVCGEWEVPTEGELPPRLCVDLQGIVRGDDFSEKRVWDIDPEVARNIFCIKGTCDEVAYLPARVREEQKERLLVITNGPNGVELFHKGEYRRLEATAIDDLPDTIGAGDTLMGWLTAGMYQGMKPEVAAVRAMRRTEQFLRAKRRF